MRAQFEIVDVLVESFGRSWELWSRRYIDEPDNFCYYITKNGRKKMSYWRKYDAKRGLLLRKNRGE